MKEAHQFINVLIIQHFCFYINNLYDFLFKRGRNAHLFKFSVLSQIVLQFLEQVSELRGSLRSFEPWFTVVPYLLFSAHLSSYLTMHNSKTNDLTPLKWFSPYWFLMNQDALEKILWPLQGQAGQTNDICLQR